VRSDNPEQPEYADRVEELETVVDALEAENTRLRTDYARRKSSYRKTALALAAIGALAVLGGIGLPDVRAVLFVTGSIGLFGSAMTWYLTPERVVPIAVSGASTMRPRRRLPVFAMNLAYSRRRRTCLSATKFAGSCRATAISTHQKTQCVFVTDDDASRLLVCSRGIASQVGSNGFGRPKRQTTR